MFPKRLFHDVPEFVNFLGVSDRRFLYVSGATVEGRQAIQRQLDKEGTWQVQFRFMAGELWRDYLGYFSWVPGEIVAPGSLEVRSGL